ncbi:MAG: GHKL domain-containing protein [candidate division Zixibacteria bacterium]|nr:GHKL domain-containing protein [candidate division Zixibacteria bacterium]
MRRSKRARSGVKSLYVGKSTAFKLFLLGGVTIVSAVFIWYTFNVIEKLKADTRSQVEKYVRMWQLAANSNMSGYELQFIFDEIIVKANFPIVVLDSERRPIHSRNVADITVGDNSPEALEKLTRVAEEMVEQNGDFPLVYANESDSFVNYFCYGDSAVINQLKVMPFIEIGIIFAFMLVAIIGFQNIRRSEERHIWVGMAKETAHQLGTPISSLMGWLQVMESEKTDCLNPQERQLLDETLSNMKIDIARLHKVADRFGKIGSVPELKPCNLNEIVTDAVEYYRRRLPFEGKGIQIEFAPENLPETWLNPELFGWTLENMIKNALQSVDSKSGLVTIRTSHQPTKKRVLLEIEDNGPGITAAAARKIFRAGFTTKKRGWGLGLTLVKRIVEEYHGGHIHLKKSKPGETVFEITLPLEPV